jgi:tetratricopeptide (TPR) repeat protein
VIGFAKMALYDFNKLERTATKLMEAGRVADAIKVYLFMADGDPSLDAGYLGERLGICYEKVGDLHAAKYWYGRAVEENPEVRLASTQAYERLLGLSVDDLMSEMAVADPAP